MASWTDEELRRIDQATELRISSRRQDGTDRPWVTIWVTTLDDAVYVRSANGPDAGWFPWALRSGVGRIDAGGVTKDVRLELADPAVREQLDHKLHLKYDRYGPGPIGAITGPDVLKTTLRITPA